MKAVWHWIASRCPYVVLAGLLLTLPEAVWLGRSGYAFSAERASILVASSMVALFFSTLLVEAAYGVTCRLSSRWAPLLMSLASLPWVVMITSSLFSGRMIGQVSGFVYMRAAFGIALLITVALTTYVVPKISKARSSRVAWQVAFLLAMVAFSYVDNHVLLGLYPAFHYLALAGAIGCAAVPARMLLPPEWPRPVSRTVAFAVAAAAIAIWGLTWNTRSARHLVAYSDGVAPKLRRIGARFLRPPSEPRLAPSAESATTDIRLSPTQDPELDEIRENVQNVILVVIDALRADHVGKIQDDMSLTPHLDALKEESISFRTAYSPGSFTGKALPSLMSSFDAPVVDTIADFETPLVSWLEHLTQRGRRSFANGLCDHLNIWPMFRLEVASCFGAEAIGTRKGRDENLVSEVVAFADGANGPFAVYTHWLDAHVPLNEIGNYAEQVRLLDGRMGDLVDGLRSAGRWDETMLIVTSDHGYYLGENGRRANGGCCGDIQMRVPLIVRLPGSRFAGQEVHTLVTSAQIPVTILDLLQPDGGFPVGAESLLYTLYVWDGSPPRFVYGDDDEVGMARLESHKIHWDTRRDLKLLYDLDADPFERSPIADESVMLEIEERLARERRRHTEQSVFLVNAADSKIPAEALAVTLAEDVQIGPLTEVMGRFWDYEPTTRVYLLETLFTRDVASAGPALEAIVRDPDHEDDQLLMIMLAFASVPDACEDLVWQMPELDLRAKVFLAQVIARLPDECLSTLAQPFTKEIMRVHALEPELRSDDGRFLAVAVYTLAKRLGPSLPGPLKVVLRDVHRRFVESRTSISTLEDPYLAQGDLMTALMEATTLDDLDLLGSIPVTHFTTRGLYEKCAEADDERCRTILLNVAEAAQRAHLKYMVVNLERRSKSKFAPEFRAAALARFPDL